jgi:hypothetical protein
MDNTLPQTLSAGNPDNPPLIGLADIARYCGLGITPGAISRWIAHKGFPAERWGDEWVSNCGAVDGWMESETTHVRLPKDILDHPLRNPEEFISLLAQTCFDLFFDWDEATRRFTLKRGLRVGKDVRLEHLLRLADMLSRDRTAERDQRQYDIWDLYPGAVEGRPRNGTKS